MAKTFSLSIVFKAVNQVTKPIKNISNGMKRVKSSVEKAKTSIREFSHAAVLRLKKIRDAAKKVGSRFSGLGKKLKLGMAGIAASIAGAATAMVAAVVKLTGAADIIGKTADRIGITTDELQKLRFAAEQTGLSTSEMDKSLEQFSRRIGEAGDGTGEAYDAFKKLRITIRDSNGQLKPMRDILDEVADKTSKMSSQTEKADILYGLFGRTGVKMINTLKGGSKGLKSFSDQLEKSGGIIPEEMIRQSEEFNDSINLLKKSLMGFVSTALTPLIPRMTEIIKKTTEWIGSNKQFIKDIGEAGKIIFNIFIFMAKIFNTVGKTIGVSIGWIVTEIEKLAFEIKNIFNDISRFINEIISGIAGFVQKVSDIVGKAKTLKQEIFGADTSKEATMQRLSEPDVFASNIAREKSQTEVTVKVISDQNTEAKVDQVKKVSGDAKVNVSTDSLVGAFNF